MSQTIFQIDAFSDEPFGGNPAAVCLLAEARDAPWMQAVAAEMNLSETAFLVGREDGAFDLRWFTPAVEVDLCGHATLASAHFIWEQGYLEAAAQARFHTRSGLLTARRQGAWVEMDFPATPASPAPAPAGLLKALGIDAVWTGLTRFDYLVEVASEREVRDLRPNMALLEAIPVRGVMVTSRASTPEFDFVSRFFAPGAGVPEDPVTGSAHCALGPYWSERLGLKEMRAYQASARGGTVRVAAAGDRVLLAGQAVTVLRAELLV